MSRFASGLLAGAAAGAAGTTVLNAVTYLDMAVRGRPSSNTPQRSVEAIAQRLGVEVPGEGDTRDNRLQGLGPMLGIVTGVGVGALAGGVVGAADVRPPFGVLALALGLGAMAGSDAPMTALGISDPRSWSASAWLSDLVPHLAYGAAAAAVLRAAVIV